jgi:Na+(H+)/acetate symporter ActP
MSNSGFIAAMGSVAAALFFLAATLCGAAQDRTTLTEVMFVAALVLCGIYLFVSLFWGLRATTLESFQIRKRDRDEDED